MDGDQFGAIGKCRLDLHVVDHLRHPFHALITGQHMAARLHHVGDRASVARALHHSVGDQGNGLRVVELDAPRQPLARDLQTAGSDWPDSNSSTGIR